MTDGALITAVTAAGLAAIVAAFARLVAVVKFA
jgi:hypothetical protein